MAPQLFLNTLRVGGLAATVQFYIEVLGFRLLTQSGPRAVLAPRAVSTEGVPTLNALREGAVALELIEGTGAPYRHGGQDVYWKIGLGLRDVQAAVDALRARGVHVSAPKQLLDIGYLCHMADPSEFTIELLQHHFQQNFTPAPLVPGEPLGHPPVIGQITLRVTDITSTLEFYRSVLGMQYVSRQSTPFGFTLYFLITATGPESVPPDPDVDAVANREWLWQRQFTSLELVHADPSPRGYRLPAPDAMGFQGMTFYCDAEEWTDVRQRLKEYPTLKRDVHHDADLDAECLVVADPDGVPVRVVRRG